MARGEALANKTIINDYSTFHKLMTDITKEYGYKETKINLSTIMPNTIADRNLIDIFKDSPVNIYYSLYSINPKFRDEWLPNAIPWEKSLNKLSTFQKLTNNPIAFHFAIIKDHNDDLDDIKRMTDALIKFDFNKTKFNIVRFNPPPNMSQYQEASEERINEIYTLLKSISKDDSIETNKTRIVPRADPIVRASCGMFVTQDEFENL